MPALSPVSAAREILGPRLAETRPPATSNDKQPDFHGVFTRAVETVDKFQQNAATQVEQLLTGEPVELHQVALAAQRAEMSLEMFMQVRNKVVQAYQEVMRMQL